MPITHCLLCSLEDLASIVDLGEHPLADTFLKKERLQQEEPRYPLRVYMCRTCGHAMGGFVVSAEKRYQEHEYSYSAGNSPVSVGHFAEMADELIENNSLDKDDLVVDIGSNDGTLLKAVREKSGARVLGVEPSQIAEIAEEKGIPTVQDFFGLRAVDRIVEEGKARAIVATNVFNHIEDLDTFMRSIRSALTPGGIFVFEVPYLLTLVEKIAFDTIYLEHISYFSVKPLIPFFKKHGFIIVDIGDNDYMGGSIRISVSTDGEESSKVAGYVKKEEDAHLFDPATYVEFSRKVLQFKTSLLSDLRALKREGGRIIGIGAATKGNTLLNYCGIDTSLLEFVTDSSPLKIGKYMPGSRIPIKGDDAISDDITHALILPWNIASFLKEKIAAKHPKLAFITPHME